MVVGDEREKFSVLSRAGGWRGSNKRKEKKKCLRDLLVRGSTRLYTFVHFFLSLTFIYSNALFIKLNETFPSLMSFSYLSIYLNLLIASFLLSSPLSLSLSFLSSLSFFKYLLMANLNSGLLHSLFLPLFNLCEYTSWTKRSFP